jgi:hypothetical protein
MRHSWYRYQDGNSTVVTQDSGGSYGRASLQWRIRWLFPCPLALYMTTKYVVIGLVLTMQLGTLKTTHVIISLHTLLPSLDLNGYDCMLTSQCSSDKPQCKMCCESSIIDRVSIAGPFIPSLQIQRSVCPKNSIAEGPTSVAHGLYRANSAS